MKELRNEALFIHSFLNSFILSLDIVMISFFTKVVNISNFSKLNYNFLFKMLKKDRSFALMLWFKLKPRRGSHLEEQLKITRINIFLN